MSIGVAWLKLLIILIDSKAKANISGKLDTAPKLRFLMDPGLLRRQATIEMARNIGDSGNPNASGGRMELDITEGNVACHIRV